jgi:hypothetical protein
LPNFAGQLGNCCNEARKQKQENNELFSFLGLIKKMAHCFGSKNGTHSSSEI